MLDYVLQTVSYSQPSLCHFQSISRGSRFTILGDNSCCLDVVNIYQYSAVPDMAL